MTARFSEVRTRRFSEVRARRFSEVRARRFSEVRTRRFFEVRTRPFFEVRTRPFFEVRTRRFFEVRTRRFFEVRTRPFFFASTLHMSPRGVITGIRRLCPGLSEPAVHSSARGTADSLVTRARSQLRLNDHDATDDTVRHAPACSSGPAGARAETWRCGNRRWDGCGLSGAGSSSEGQRA